MEQNNQQIPEFNVQQSWPEGTPRPRLGFREAVSACISQYSNFSGRARRSEYWWFSLFTFIVMSITLGPALVASVVNENAFESNEGSMSVATLIVGILAIIGGVFALFILIPSIAVQVRRLHDIGRSGWWVLWSFILSVVVSIVPIFVFGIDKGTDMDEFEAISSAFQVSWIPGLITLLVSVAEWAVNIAIFIFTLLDSQRQENEYGLSPKYQ